MSILIKQAKIIQAKSSYHNTRKDILIKNGMIEKIADKITDDKAQIIKSGNLHVSLGWMDIGTVSGEPGFEHRESLESLSLTAAAGGYTALAIFPNTYPVIDNKSGIQFVKNNTSNHIVDYHPIGSGSKKCESEEITEMIDMFKSGAVAFSDGHKTIQSSGLFMRILDYSKAVNALVIHHPDDPNLSNGNTIHEGLISTELGLKASPDLSEALSLERDIQLAYYTGARYMAHNLTSKLSLEKLKNLKNKNLFASVSYLNLCLTDEALKSFDANCKVSPPLRSHSDRKELINSVNKGTIDVITSNHVPLEEELKKKEFVYAEAGAIGLQTSFSAMNTFSEGLNLTKMIYCLTINPRKVLGLPVPNIDKNEQANLCLFDPDAEWQLNDKTNCSKSKNSPFWNQKLKGKIIGVINGKQKHINNY